MLDELTFYQSAGTAAARLPAEGAVLISVLTFKVLFSIVNLLLSLRHEYTVIIGLCGGRFEAGVSAAAAAPAELLHNFLGMKSLKRKTMHFLYEIFFVIS